MIDGDSDPELNPDGHSQAGIEADPWRARPFTVTNGRTEPSASLDLMTLVRASSRATPSSDWLGIDHGPVFDLCRSSISVAEVAARLGLPLTVAKILLADLVKLGVVITRAPTELNETDLTTLEAVRDGLRAL
ncbi:DUF742 domain-containing protein [Pseudonocardia aurantiaca]|uniref:DUF742 domain-containing protein n=1 Tax=Pseudonocardia aurantiaca TaxID=75290 RepID=A0ABW4FQI4_9PSEU